MYEKEARTKVTSENGESRYFHDTKGIPRTRGEMDWSTVNSYVIPAFRGDTVHSTEKLLDYVDLKLDWYIPSAEAFEVINFIRFSLGKEPENLNSKAHYFFIDSLLTSSEVRPYFDVRNMDYNNRMNDTLILSTREFSKALTAETLIATPDGDREIIDIEDGDYVYSRTGKPTKVLKKSEMFFDTTYKMVLDDGREIKCSRDHEHILWRRKDKYLGYFDENGKKVAKGKGKLHRIYGMEEVVMTSEELELDGVSTYRKKTDSHKAGFENKYFIPRMDNPIDYPEVDSPIDPYTVGVILGDGSISLGSKLADGTRSKKTRGAVRITTHIDDVKSMLKNIPYDMKVQGKKDSSARTLVLDKRLNSRVAEFIGVDRSYTKKIPQLLMRGSARQRTELLKGLMDTDGTINKKGSRSFTSVSKELAENVRDLVFSLGGSAKISERKTESKFGVAYHVMIKINISIFKLQRKIDRERYVQARDCFAIKSFTVMQSVPSYCLAVECKTKSFLLANGLVTHNSVLVTFFMLYLAWKGYRKNFKRRIKLGLYVSDNMKGNVAQTMKTIRNLVIKSEWLSAQFEYTKFNLDHIILIRHPRSKKEISAYERAMKEGKKIEEVKYRDERTFMLKGIGASGGRGSRDDDLGRPDFAVFDDLVANEEDAYSEVKLKTIESTIEGDVASSLHAGGSFRIFIGTAYHMMDPIYRRVTDGGILPVVFPRAEVAPHGDVYDEYGNLLKPALKKEEFISVWEDRMPFETQREAYRKAEVAYESGNTKKLKSLNQEYYVRVISSAERLIPEEALKFINVSEIRSAAHLYSWFITTDFTTSNKKGSDLSVQMLWVRNAYGQDILMKISMGHKTIDEQYDDVFALIDEAEGYGARYVEVGIETDGPQQIHLYSIKKRATELNRFIDIAHQINPQTEYKPMANEGLRSQVVGNKMARLRIRADQVESGNVFINEDIKRYDVKEWEEFDEELRMTTGEDIKSRHDDVLDAFSQPVLMHIELPSKELFEESKPKEIKAVNYLDMVMATSFNGTENLRAEVDDDILEY